MPKLNIPQETLGKLNRTYLAPNNTRKNSYEVRENVRTASYKVKTRQENVSGVMLPAFEKWIDGSDGT
jgi:vacuolar-type H+-ATPase subunit D/Vma8